MPHCVMEYSTDINAELLVDEVFEAALSSGLFDVSGSDIKVRAIPYALHKTGGQHTSFVHLCLKILSGRTPEQKRHLSETVLNRISAHIPAACSCSVEVVDIDRASYTKVIT